jgi:hypothetical protein
MNSDLNWGGLDNSLDPEMEAAWLEEADRRWDEIESGKVEVLSAERVMKDAWAALRKGS